MKKFCDVLSKKETSSTASAGHKMSAECFTKCAKWKLSCTLTYNKTSTGMIFQGKAYFFKKPTSNILTQFQLLDNVTEISKSAMKTLEEKAYSKENNTSDQDLNYADIKFPLNNNDSSEILNSGTVLANSLFFEFCVNSCNISKEHLKCFREINNDYVDKELHFVLNATIHGKPMFQNEIRFSVEARKFIKSMQFRLQNYKRDFVEKQRQIQRSNPNFEIKNSKNGFFTKIVSNPYIGIEFNKPNFENVEAYPTNFNSIVNSSITISRFFLEIGIPAAIINPNSTKNEVKANFEGLMKSYSTFTNLKDGKALDSSLNISRERSSQYGSSSVTGSKSTRKCEKSIYENSNYYYPKSANNSNKFSMCFGNKFNCEKTDPLSFISSTFLDQNFNNNKFLFTSQEVFQSNNKALKCQCLHVLLTHYENLCNFLIFAQNCTPHVHKAETHLIDDIKLQNYFSNFDHAAAFGIDINYIYDNTSICQVNYSPTLSSMMIMINDVISCDAIIKELFMLRQGNSSVGQFIDLSISSASSFSASNSSDTEQEYGSKRANSGYNLSSGEYKDFEYQVNENLKFSCINDRVMIQYQETKPPHSRHILSDQLQMIMKSLKALEMIDLAKVDKTSWFCILWSPLRASRTQFGNTSFLVYYQFSYSDNEIYYRGFCDYMEIPLIGILPVKFDEGIWLKKITRVNYTTFGHGLHYTSDLLDFKMALNDSINNVHEFVLSNLDRTSLDYEFYVKNIVTNNSMMSSI